jgi:hypothetical protein
LVTVSTVCASRNHNEASGSCSAPLQRLHRRRCRHGSRRGSTNHPWKRPELSYETPSGQLPVLPNGKNPSLGTRMLDACVYIVCLAAMGGVTINSSMNVVGGFVDLDSKSSLFELTLFAISAVLTVIVLTLVPAHVRLQNVRRRFPSNLVYTAQQSSAEISSLSGFTLGQAADGLRAYPCGGASSNRDAAISFHGTA